MHTSNNLRLTGAALCGALLISGCANQLPQRSEHEERVERKLLDHQLQIDAGEPRGLHHADDRLVRRLRIRMRDEDGVRPLATLNGTLVAITRTIVALLVASTPGLYQPIFGTPLKWAAIFAPLAFVLFFELIREIGPVKASLITYVNTAVALLLGIVFLAEPVTPGLLIGIPMITLGLYLSAKK